MAIQLVTRNKSMTPFLNLKRILHETKTTCCFLDLVETDDDPFHISAFREQIIDLLLCGVEREISNIKRIALFQQLFLVIPITLEEETPEIRSLVHWRHRTNSQPKNKAVSIVTLGLLPQAKLQTLSNPLNGITSSY